MRVICTKCHNSDKVIHNDDVTELSHYHKLHPDDGWHDAIVIRSHEVQKINRLSKYLHDKITEYWKEQPIRQMDYVCEGCGFFPK